jgi:predicted  nucleic acid-binding Zn-ribbon protein
MEAAVAEKEAGMTEWNDARLDEFGKRVDEGFAEMRGEFTQVRAEVRGEFSKVRQEMRDEFTSVNNKIDQFGQNVDNQLERIEAKIDDKFSTFHRMLFQASWGFALALIGVIAVIAAKL